MNDHRALCGALQSVMLNSSQVYEVLNKNFITEHHRNCISLLACSSPVGANAGTAPGVRQGVNGCKALQDRVHTAPR